MLPPQASWNELHMTASSTGVRKRTKCSLTQNITYRYINHNKGCASMQVWDLKAGQLLRTQTVHRGMVMCLAYATSAKLLFSGSIDGSIGVWTDKGNLLQVSTNTAEQQCLQAEAAVNHPCPVVLFTLAP
jgi:WD40 repeat protein